MTRTPEPQPSPPSQMVAGAVGAPVQTAAGVRAEPSAAPIIGGLVALGTAVIGVLGALFIWALTQLDADIEANTDSIVALGERMDDRLVRLETETDVRFVRLEEKMDSRFVRLEEKMDSRFDAVDDRFEAVDDRFDAVDDRIDEIALNVAAILTILQQRDATGAALAGQESGLVADLSPELQPT